MLTIIVNWPDVVCRAWKKNLIKLVPDRTKLLCMNDELGDIMYGENMSVMNAK